MADAPVRDDLLDESYDKRWIALPVLALTSLVAIIDNLIVTVALPTLVDELGATITQLQWIVNAYVLVFAVMLLTFGSLADRLGRKRFFVGGLVCFGLASVVAATAQTPTQLIIGRGLMGFAAAIVFPTTLAIISDMFRDPREKSIAIGVWSASTGVGVATAPVIGGFLLEHFAWGSIFVVNIPVAAAAIVSGVLVLRESKDTHPRRLDLGGMVLSAVAVGASVWSIIEGPHLGWSSFELRVGAVVAVLASVAFITYELHRVEPMLDMRFFADRRFRGGNLSVVAVELMIFAFSFLGIQYLQYVAGYSPLETGVRLLPLAFAVAVSSPLSTLLANRIGHRTVVTAGLLITASGAFAASRLSVVSPYGDVTIILVLLGVGLGAAMTPATDSVMSSLPTRFAGVGSALNDVTRELGGALGVAIGGSIAATSYTAAVISGFAGTPMTPEGLTVATESLGGAHAVAKVAATQLGPDAGTFVTGVANNAFMSGFSTGMFAIAIIGSLAAVVVALTLPRHGSMTGPMQLQAAADDTDSHPVDGGVEVRL